MEVGGKGVSESVGEEETCVRVGSKYSHFLKGYDKEVGVDLEFVICSCVFSSSSQCAFIACVRS